MDTQYGEYTQETSSWGGKGDKMAYRLEAVVSAWNNMEPELTDILLRLFKLVGKDESRFDPSAEIPGTSRSTSELQSVVAGISGVINGLETATNTYLLTEDLTNNVVGAIQNILSNAVSLRAIEQALESQDGVGTVDQSAFTINSVAGQQHEFSADLTALSTNIDNLIHHLNPFRMAVGLDVVQSDPRVSIDEIRKHIAGLDDDLGRVTNLLQKLEQDQKSLGETVANATSELQQIVTIHGQVNEAQTAVSGHQAESEAKLAVIRELSVQADTLKVSVQGYQSTFDSFQEQLDQRQKEITEGRAAYEKLTKEVDDQKSEIIRLTSEAEGMLTGATTAGLAGEFAKRRDELSVELGSARRGFYFSIIFLLVSVTPLLAFVFQGVISELRVIDDPTFGEKMADLVVRALILVPAIWLTKFMAARHAALFRLREHYGYKYSIAASVEGFKRQAETHKEEIAAIAFNELTFNPAERMDSRHASTRSPNPAMNWLMDKFGLNERGQSG